MYQINKGLNSAKKDSIERETTHRGPKMLKGKEIQQQISGSNLRKKASQDQFKTKRKKIRCKTHSKEPELEVFKKVKSPLFSFEEKYKTKTWKGTNEETNESKAEQLMP